MLVNPRVYEIWVRGRDVLDCIMRISLAWAACQRPYAGRRSACEGDIPRCYRALLFGSPTEFSRGSAPRRSGS